MAETFHLRIVSPSRIFYEGEAEFVEMKTVEGRIGVYAGHVPATVILDPGLLVIRGGGRTRKAALHTGFAQILPDRVSIMAEIAEWPEEIDGSRAEEARIRARRNLESGEDERSLRQAEMELKKALARLEAVDRLQ